MRIGMALPHYDFSFPDGGPASVKRVSAYARRAEAAGFDSVWLSDHLFLDLERYGGPADRSSTPEALTTLAVVASETERVRVGSLVLCAPFRPAALTALAARGIHDLSGGRFDLGLGAGWYEPEFEVAGIPYGTAGERLQHLARYAGDIRGGLGAPAAGRGDGKDSPTIWIGGKGGPKVARIVAEHADGWNVVWRMTPSDYDARLETLRRACDAADRDPGSVRLSVGLYTLLGRDERDLAHRFEAMRAWALGGLLDGTSLEVYADGALVGTAEQVAERIAAFEARGVEEVILGFGPVPFSLPDDEQIDLAAAELFPLLR